MKINNHRLEGDNVSFQQTQNYYNPPYRTATGLPDSIIIHYTAMTTSEGAVKALTIKKPAGGNASAHMVIGKDGEVKQLASFDQRTWHAGESEYHGRKGYNSLAVGIEIDNVGWLQKYPDGTYSRALLLTNGFKLQEKDVLHARHFNPNVPYEYWEKYTDAQITTAFEICKLLYQTYGIKEILGHDQIAPARKQDPGPAFPMDEFRNGILTDRSDPLESAGIPKAGLVATNLLNIRAGAGVAFEKVAKPLLIHTPVEILGEQDGWYRVRTQVEGWVSKDFITPGT